MLKSRLLRLFKKMSKIALPTGGILQKVILIDHGKDSMLAKAIGNDYKGKVSLVLYLIAVLVTKFSIEISGAIYILVALIWLIPDKRIERTFNEKK